jgi:hypothetical protein
VDKKLFGTKSKQKESKIGLPVGTFSNQKSQLGCILEGPGTQKISLFYGHLVFESCLFNYIAIWYILWSFGI